MADNINNINEKNENISPVLEEKNKTPHWSQRCASGMIDVGILLILFFIFNALLNLSPLGDQLDGYKNEMAIAEKNAAIVEVEVDGQTMTYGYIEYITEENQDKYASNHHFKDDDGKEYVVVVNEFEDQETFLKVEAIFKDTVSKDPAYKNALFNYRLVRYGVDMISLSISEAILILIIPLLSKKRATLGQLLAGTRCVNNKLETPARWWKIVIRYFWVMIFELGLPCLSMLGTYSIIVVPLILYLIAQLNKKKRTLRDYVSATKFIDNKSFVPLGHHN